jgi:hypothetical protein
LNSFSAGPNSYWKDLIKECTEESYRIAENAEMFVHTQMIPELFEQESVEDKHAFFSQLDWTTMREKSPLLWKTLAPQALQTEETLVQRGQTVLRNAQLQAMQNPPNASQVLQHLFGDQAVGVPPGKSDLAPGMQDQGAQALDQLNDLEKKQDQAFKPEVQPSAVFGLKLPSQRGASETAGQGLEDLPMGRGG